MTRIEEILTDLSETRELLWKELDGISETVFNLRNQVAPNSIGMLCEHLAGAEGWWIHHLIGGAPTSRNRADEFVARVVDIEAAKSLLSEMRATSIKVIESLRSDDLDQVKETGNDWKPRCSIAWALYHIISHENRHLGQIQMLRRLAPDS